MSNWKVILATLVIFTAGLVTGGLLVRNVKKTKPKEAAVARTEVLRRLTRDLDLAPQQRTKINEIIQESHERTKILRELFEPELKVEYRKAVEGIRTALTAEQRARFDELLKQRPRKAAGSTEKRRPAPSNSLSGSTNLLLSLTNLEAGVPD